MAGTEEQRTRRPARGRPRRARRLLHRTVAAVMAGGLVAAGCSSKSHPNALSTTSTTVEGQSGAGYDPAPAEISGSEITGAAATSTEPGASVSPSTPAAGTSKPFTPVNPPTPDRVKAAVSRFLPPFIQKHQVTGLSIAVVTPDAGDASRPHTEIMNFGVMSRTTKEPVTSSTLWQMGSESKLFTAAVLAQLADTKSVGLTEDLQSILPNGVTAPSRDNIQIELRDLATHHSGLPDMPTNVDQTNPQQRADYTDAKLRQFLEGYKLPWDPGNSGTWLYSNLAFGILGTALAGHEGTDFNTLLQRVTGPLGMTQTRVQTERTPPIPGMAQGYNSSKSKPPNQPVAFYNFMQPLVGGGGLLSSINDMATFVAASLGFNPSSVTPALLLTQQPMAPGPVPNKGNAQMTMGLAWQLSTSPSLGVPIEYKNGATSGFKSATVLLPNQRIGITILSNGPLDPTPPMVAVAKGLLT